MTLNNCFNCNKFCCDECPILEPETNIINPETDKPLTKDDIDEIMARR